MPQRHPFHHRSFSERQAHLRKSDTFKLKIIFSSLAKLRARCFQLQEDRGQNPLSAHTPCATVSRKTRTECLDDSIKGLTQNIGEQAELKAPIKIEEKWQLLLESILQSATTYVCHRYSLILHGSITQIFKSHDQQLISALFQMSVAFIIQTGITPQSWKEIFDVSMQLVKVSFFTFEDINLDTQT